MNDDQRLSDDQVQDRLQAAFDALGAGDGETTYGGAAMRSARRTLEALGRVVDTRRSQQQATNDNHKDHIET